MSTKLVKEDSYGTYIEAGPVLLEQFDLVENNPNFEVYDAKEGGRRLVIAKSSRLPDDNNFHIGRYGINFHRKKPDYEEAFNYRNGMQNIANTQHILSTMAFVADNREDYEQKAAAWDKFYSYIWGRGAMTIWVTPHSGSITRRADALLPWPKQEADACVSGVAAACAAADNASQSKRIMMSIHSHNWLGAAVDIGDFNIIEEDRLAALEDKLNQVYADKVRPLTEACKKRFSTVAADWISHIYKANGTLNPVELAGKSTHNRGIMILIIKSVEMYGAKIEKFTPEEFTAAIKNIAAAPLQVMSRNYLFSGRHISEIIGIKEKISAGKMDGAAQIECNKVCLEKDPELLKQIILDIKKELFD